MALRPWLIAVAGLLGVSCFDDGGSGGDGNGCPVASEGCPCTSGDGCDEGLVCRSDVCVSLDDQTGGTGGASGESASGGSGSGDGDGGSGASTTGDASTGDSPTDADPTTGGVGGTTSGGATTGGDGGTGGGSTSGSGSGSGPGSTGGNGGTTTGGGGSDTGDVPPEDPLYPKPGANGCPGDTALLDAGTKYCGAPCDANAECPAPATGWPDAYCAYNPDSSANTCTNDNQCAVGETCEDNAGGTKSCLAPASHCALFCFTDVENCPVQMVCDPLGGGGTDGLCVYP